MENVKMLEFHIVSSTLRFDLWQKISIICRRVYPLKDFEVFDISCKE